MDTAGSEQPSEALRVQSLLRSMGVEDFEPRVVNMLVDFIYKYTTDVVLDAEAYSEHAGKPAGVVEMDDAMLAIQARTAYSFIQPPPQELLAEAAAKFNARDLPKFPAHRPGLLIPDEKECLTALNVQLSLGEGATPAAAAPAAVRRAVKPMQL